MSALRAILAVALSLTGTVAASAADPAPVDMGLATIATPPSVYTWSGPYVGGFVGYADRNVDQSGGATFSNDGFIGGVYTGFNVQNDNLVYGIEGDVGGANVDGGGFNAAAGLPVAGDAGAFGSVRARLGVAYDPFMFFATGGAAVANNELTLGGVSDSNTHWGWTLGAGIEAFVTDNITSRVEYRYSDYESQDYNLGNNVEFSSGFDEHSIRAGLALRF